MRRVERARNWGLWLTTAACAAGLLGAMPVREAAAQEASTAQADELAAETAYLRAYFTEKEAKDLAAADAAYAAILGMRGVPQDLAVRVRLGRVRCLHGLRRGDEARTALAAATSAAKDGAAITATTRDALEAATALLNAKDVDDDAGTLEERIVVALRSGDIKTTVLPFGDRALSPLRSILLTSDDVNLNRRAAEAIAALDTDASRKHVKALMAQYDALRFPREFAVAVARSMPFDMVAELAAPLPVETRRAMWTTALGVFRPFTDADARRILADRDARPSPSSFNGRSPALVRYLLRGLLDGDDVFRRATEEVVRSRRGSDTAEALDAWFSAPADVIADDAARAALIDGVYGTTTWDKQAITLEFIRAMAKTPEGAALYLRACSQGSARRTLVDAEALRTAVTHDSPRFSAVLAGTAGFGRSLEAAGLTEADELPRLIASWRCPVPIEQVFRDCASLMTPSPAQATALLDPANPPSVLVLFLSTWRSNSAQFRSDAAEACFRRIAALTTHTSPAVRSAAADMVSSLAMGRRLPDDIDLPTILGIQVNHQTRAALLAAVPKSHTGDLIAALRDDGRTLEPLLTALGSDESPEIAPRLREILSATSDPSVAAIAARGLIWRTKGADDAAIAAVIADPARSAALRGEVALACLGVIDAAEREDPSRDERIIDALFARTPVPVPLGQGHPVTLAVAKLSAVSRRRIALAALASPADSDRRYGADLVRQLRDPAAWDRLVVLAEDPEPTVRDAARKALDAIADEEEAVRRYRRVAATKKTRDEIPALLASASADDRLAGIAAVVAIEDDSQTAELVRLATKDAEEPVRQAARRALETLGDRRVMAREAARRHEQPTKPAPEATPK